MVGEAPAGGAQVDEQRVAQDIEAFGEVAERFYEFDTDRSGYLEENEVIEFCNSLGLEFTAEQAREALDEMEMDATRDGKVSLVEFADWWSSETATKLEGTVAGLLEAAREAGVKPKALKKMEQRAKEVQALGGGRFGGMSAVDLLTSSDNSAGARWKRAGVQTRMQLAVTDAFKDNTGRRPSDRDWKEWTFRDWPVWQCSAPIRDLEKAEARAKKSITVYAAAVLPAAIVFGLFALSTASDAEEHVTCAYHSISRITRLTEIGWLWIICSGSLGLGVCLEINSRVCLAKYITRQREQIDAAAEDGAGGAPRARGDAGSSGSVQCSAALRLGFTVSAFVGSASYFVLFCYALTLTTLMADVCEGNLEPLLIYVLLLWLWLVVALLTGVPMACFTWLRWHGCSAGDARALLYPTKFAVPPVPPAPPPVVRRLPAAARGAGAGGGGGAGGAGGGLSANVSAQQPASPAGGGIEGRRSPPPLGGLVSARSRGSQSAMRAAVRLSSPSRQQQQQPAAAANSQVMAAATRIDAAAASAGGGLQQQQQGLGPIPPGRRAPPSLASLTPRDKRSSTPPRTAAAP